MTRKLKNIHKYKLFHDMFKERNLGLSTYRMYNLGQRIKQQDKRCRNMKPEKAIRILEAHNVWRRGGEGEMCKPAELGYALDVILKFAKKHIIKLH